MTLSESTKAKSNSLTRDVLFALRYYLGSRTALLAFAIVALAGGLAFNWTWLVAIGVAPILLSTLPCLVMCAFGVCMMCRSNKTQSVTPRDAADQATSTAPGVAKMGQQSVDGSGCCHEQSNATLSSSPQMRQPHSTDERKDSHA